MKFIHFLEWFKTFSLTQRISIGLASALVLGTCGTTVAVAANTKATKEPVETVAEVEYEEEEEEPESEEERVEEITRFSSMHISASSIEKDLDIFFLDNDNQKIKGENFSVKLVSVTDAAKLNTYVDAIAKVNKEIKEVEDKPDAESRAKLSVLTTKKLDAIDEYKEALKKINGATYTDDNQDGRITQQKLEPGDFSLCYVPTAEYDAKDYTQKTTVKDHIEYKPVENIEQIAVTAEEAGDVEPVHQITTEAVLEDTVEYLPSSEYRTPAEYARTTAAELKADTSNPTPVEGKNGTITVPRDVDLYPEVRDQGTTTVGVEGGKTNDKVEVANVSEGLSATINGNKLTVTAADTTETKTGTVTLRLTRPLTSTSEVKSSEASSEAPSSSANETTGSRAPESTTTTEQTPASSSVTAPSGTEQTKEEIVEVNINVTVHGSSEQLKDDQGHELFTDDQGATTATINDYSINGVYFYMCKAAGPAQYTGWQTIDGAQYYFDGSHNKVTGTQVISGVKYKFGTDGALLTSGVGIDVSKWQGTIDWSKAKSSISFAIIRAGFRGTSGGIARDEFAITNIKGCNANGVRCGLYFYSKATTEAEAVQEASLAIDVAKSGNISLPIFIDMEDETQRGLSNDTKDAIVNAFCKTVKDAGYAPGLYASKNWIETYLTPSKYGAICMWVAQYNVTCNYKGHYDIWQYSSNGDIPGINTKVDMNEGKF